MKNFAQGYRGCEALRSVLLEWINVEPLARDLGYFLKMNLALKVYWKVLYLYLDQLINNEL